MLLDVALIDFGRARETGAQGMAGKQRQALFFGQFGSDAGVEDRALDQSCDMFVVQACFRCALAIPRGADEDRAEVDLCKVQPLFQRLDRAGLIAGAAAKFDLAPAGLGVEREEGAFVEDLNPPESGVSSLCTSRLTISDRRIPPA